MIRYFVFVLHKLQALIKSMFLSNRAYSYPLADSPTPTPPHSFKHDGKHGLCWVCGTEPLG